MQYRKEIDGLRALAIIPVIIYHSGLTFLSGGFVGVDVFFVISGYLITSIIRSELETGMFSFKNFYERRARRILPALYVVLFCTIPLAYLWMSPHDLRKFSKNLLGGVLFISNLVSYKESNYFDTSSLTKPLLHLWSLSIEEQFYLFFPIIFILLWKISIKKIILALLLIFAISLYISELMLDTKSAASFYLLTSRAWELVIGSLASFIIFKNSNKNEFYREILAFLGLTLIVCSLLFFDRNISFPGLHALLPTFGASLILIFGTKNTLTGKILANKYLVKIGLLSYGAYLWHQPAFAFFNYKNISSPNLITSTLLIIFTMILAYLSWKYIETPMRDKKRYSSKFVWRISLLGAIIFIALGSIGYLSKGFPYRFPSQLENAFYPPSSNEHKLCNFKTDHDDQNIKICEFGDLKSQSAIILFGDSHASSLLASLDSIFKSKKVKGLRVKLNENCHSIPRFISGEINEKNKIKINECLNNFNHFLEYTKKNADGIIISIYWTPKLLPLLEEPYYFDNGEGGVASGNADLIKPNLVLNNNYELLANNELAKKNAVLFLLDSLKDTHKKLFLVYPIPEVGWDIPRYNFKDYLKNKDIKPLITTSYEKYKKRNEFINNIFDTYNFNNVIKIKSGEILCDKPIYSRCLAQLNSNPLYLDNNHLSLFGANIIAKEISEKM